MPRIPYDTSRGSGLVPAAPRPYDQRYHVWTEEELMHAIVLKIYANKSPANIADLLTAAFPTQHPLNGRTVDHHLKLASGYMYPSEFKKRTSPLVTHPLWLEAQTMGPMSPAVSFVLHHHGLLSQEELVERCTAGQGTDQIGTLDQHGNGDMAAGDGGRLMNVAAWVACLAKQQHEKLRVDVSGVSKEEVWRAINRLPSPPRNLELV
ncbi:hypothetical protein MMC13_005864 [Lambiella insularis]|nr:hypothetical protein [Lambiella insularis]